MPPEAYPVVPRGFFLWGLVGTGVGTGGGECGASWGAVWGPVGARGEGCAVGTRSLGDTHETFSRGLEMHFTLYLQGFS